MQVTAVNMSQTISVAILVIAGEFGSGEERKKKLEESGYDYKKVQACVNELWPVFLKYGG